MTSGRKMIKNIGIFSDKSSKKKVQISLTISSISFVKEVTDEGRWRHSYFPKKTQYVF